VPLSPDFPAGKFRVPVQFPAQRYRQIQKPFIQARNPPWQYPGLSQDFSFWESRLKFLEKTSIRPFFGSRSQN
jgi:hypothetical protein